MKVTMGMLWAIALGLALSVGHDTDAKPADGRSKTKGKTTKTPAIPSDPALQCAEKVQRLYDVTKDFSADFIQQYTRVALSRTSESRGTVKVLKPGMMRWDYVEPQEKHFIADGKELIVYDPEENLVTKNPHFKVSEVGSSLSFLFGHGRITDAFSVALGDRTKSGASDHIEILELTPKKDATYVKLELMVDKTTGRVEESVIHETTGNTNRFKFKNIQTNKGIAPNVFAFSPPPGAEISVVSQ